MQAAVAEGRTQVVVAAMNNNAPYMNEKSQKAPMAATKPRNQEKSMMVTPPTLQYLPDDFRNALPADEQVTRPVDIEIQLDRILLGDWPATPNSVIR